MATIVSNGNYIKAVLDYSYSRTSSGVYLNYSLYLQRLNGYQSYGTISYNVAVNGLSIKSGSGIKLTVPGNSTAHVFSGATYTVGTGVFNGGNFGLSFSTSGDISNFNHSGSATVYYDAYATGVGTPSVSITDNGNNTFSISATKGSSGTNNAATGVGDISYSFNNSNWISGSSGSITGNTTVYARAYTTGTYNNSGYASTSAYVKYYSRPGKPTVTISDDGSGTVTISATKGSDGSNNAATAVSDIQYSFNNSTWTNYSSPFTITESQTVYARARTKGTYTGNSNAYLYSDYTVVRSSVTAITKCGKPDLSLSSSILRFNSNNLILFISATSGVNNNITGYEIQYSASDTLSFYDWSDSLYIDTSEDIYDFVFPSRPEYFEMLKSLNKKYICFSVKTIGSVSGYDSDYNRISIMTDKGYPRFKNSEGVYKTCIPYNVTQINPTILTDNQTINSSATLVSLNSKINLVVGNSYQVNLNGSSYTCVCRLSETTSLLYIGNQSLTWATDSIGDTGEPFIIYTDPDTGAAEMTVGSGSEFWDVPLKITVIDLNTTVNTWTQCVLNSSVLSKLKDSSGEYILDNNGENIYTLEDSSVILNS